MSSFRKLQKLQTALWLGLLKRSRYFKSPRAFLTPFVDGLIWLAERYYRRHFRRFRAALIQKTNSQKHSGVMFVTHALNPCGSIRQAVLLMQQLTMHHLPLLGLIVIHLDSESNRFYLPALLSQNVPVETLQPTSAATEHPALKHLPKRLQRLAHYLEPIARHHPRVVHAWQDGKNIKVGLAALMLGLPKIVLSTSHVPPCHFLFYRPYMREAYRLLVRQAQVTLVNNSDFGAKAYERWLGLPAGSVQVVRNSFDFDPKNIQHAIVNRLEYRRQIPVPPECKLVGSVMRLTEEKQPLLWLEIALKLHRQDPSIHFLMIGDGPLKNVVRQQIERYELSNVLHLIYEERRPMDAIAAMDVMLITPRTQGLSNALIEAQAVNVPVITTKAGSTPEAILPEQTGWMIDEKDTNGAARLILHVLHDQKTREIAGRLGPHFVQEHFSAHQLLSKYLKIYGGLE